MEDALDMKLSNISGKSSAFAQLFFVFAFVIMQAQAGSQEDQFSAERSVTDGNPPQRQTNDKGERGSKREIAPQCGSLNRVEQKGATLSNVDVQE